MRAFFVVSHSPGAQTSGPVTLLPLLDRSFLQHTVEYVLDQGIREIDFIIAPAFAGVKTLFASEVRWGGRFHFHTAPEGDSPADVIRMLAGDANAGPVVIAHADRLPDAPIQEALAMVRPTLFYSRHGHQSVWTGWGVVPAEALRHLPAGAQGEAIGAYLRYRDENTRIVEVAPPLSSRSCADILDANRRALSGEHPSLVLRGQEVRPGLWLGRNVSVHPSAELVPPVYVGENTRLGPNAMVGPAVAIGSDCVIDQTTKISHSVVCAGSYVGRGLALKDVLVDRSTLVNTRLNVAIEDVDEFLLGDFAATPWRARLGRGIERVLALLLLLPALPVLAVLLAFAKWAGGPRLCKKTILRTPAVSDPARWKTFDMWSFGGAAPGKVRNLFCFALPALVQVAFGRLAFSGPAPLTIREIGELPARERSAHLRSRAGLFQAAAGKN